MSTSERRDNIQEESTGGRRATEGHATPEDGERRGDYNIQKESTLGRSLTEGKTGQVRRFFD